LSLNWIEGRLNIKFCSIKLFFVELLDSLFSGNEASCRILGVLEAYNGKPASGSLWVLPDVNGFYFTILSEYLA